MPNQGGRFVRGGGFLAAQRPPVLASGLQQRGVLIGRQIAAQPGQIPLPVHAGAGFRETQFLALARQSGLQIRATRRQIRQLARGVAIRRFKIALFPTNLLGRTGGQRHRFIFGGRLVGADQRIQAALLVPHERKLTETGGRDGRLRARVAEEARDHAVFLQLPDLIRIEIAQFAPRLPFPRQRLTPFFQAVQLFAQGDGLACQRLRRIGIHGRSGAGGPGVGRLRRGGIENFESAFQRAQFVAGLFDRIAAHFAHGPQMQRPHRAQRAQGLLPLRVQAQQQDFFHGHNHDSPSCGVRFLAILPRTTAAVCSSPK